MEQEKEENQKVEQDDPGSCGKWLLKRKWWVVMMVLQSVTIKTFPAAK